MSNNVAQELPISAFNELITTQNTPLFQVTAQYGILDDILTAAIGGTTTTEDAKFKVSTGTGSNNVAAIISRREAQYKAGQGLMGKLTAIFTTGAVNSTQQAGFITSESAFGFGYNGAEFGIVHAKDGELENQELQITTAATTAATCTVTVDGTAYNPPLTVATVQVNAYEIATFLDANVNGYRFTSNDDTVYCLAQLPDFGSGSFAFAADTTGAAATWTEIKNGTLPTETWTPLDDWDNPPDYTLDPTKGNVYAIQVQYLGFGGIRFFVENPDTATLELVHTIKYANTATAPSVKNPIFRLGWAARNTGNTSDIIVQGASAGAFIEGKIVFDALPKGVCNTQTGVTTTRTNVLSVRNRITFNGTANRAEVLPLGLDLNTDSVRGAFFEVIESPTYAAAVNWSFHNSSTSLLEVATDSVEVTGGNVLACYPITAARSIMVNEILDYISPETEIAITAKIISGPNSDMDVSFTWKDDL